MDDIQKLADEIAKAYLRYLKAKTGGDRVTYDGVTKQVTPEELAFGLVGVAHYNAKRFPEDPILSNPHKHLSEMINLFSNPYSITEFGLSVVDAMSERSIHKDQGDPM